jgi:hypothetical protein
VAQRLDAEFKCRLLGWVIVPYDAGDLLSKSVAKNFGEMFDDLTSLKVIVHPAVLKLIERLEEAMINKLFDLANGWRETRITKGTAMNTPVVTVDMCAVCIQDLIAELFKQFLGRIEYNCLIDLSNRQEVLVYLEIDCLKEKIVYDATKIVKEWT